MIKKLVKIRNLNDSTESADNLKYWLSRPPAERIAAVDYLRKQYYGSTARLQRSVRIIKPE